MTSWQLHHTYVISVFHLLSSSLLILLMDQIISSSVYYSHPAHQEEWPYLFQSKTGNRARAVAIKPVRRHRVDKRTRTNRVADSKALLVNRARHRLSVWPIADSRWPMADNKPIISNSVVRICRYKQERGSATSSTGQSITVTYKRFFFLNLMIDSKIVTFCFVLYRTTRAFPQFLLISSC